MGFLRPLAKTGMFGVAGLAATSGKKKPAPTLATSTKPTTTTLVNTNPTLI
jgi:hypothetical protein